MEDSCAVMSMCVLGFVAELYLTAVSFYSMPFYGSENGMERLMAGHSSFAVRLFPFECNGSKIIKNGTVLILSTRNGKCYGKSTAVSYPPVAAATIHISDPKNSLSNHWSWSPL